MVDAQHARDLLGGRTIPGQTVWRYSAAHG
jgi:hypothetical protein